MKRREEGSREWGKTMIWKPPISKLSFLPEGNRHVLKRRAPPLPWWLEGGLLWQPHVCPASKSPLLLSHVLVSPCALPTVSMAAQWIPGPLEIMWRKGHRTSHCSAALNHAKQTIGWTQWRQAGREHCAKGHQYLKILKMPRVLIPGHLCQATLGGHHCLLGSCGAQNPIENFVCTTFFFRSWQSSILCLWLLTKIGLPEPHKRKCIFMSACSSKHSITLSNTKHLLFMRNSSCQVLFALSF